MKAEVDQAALVGAERTGGLRPSGLFNLFCKRKSQFLQAGILTGMVIPCIKLQADLRIHSAGDHACGQILHCCKILAVAPDKQAGICAVHPDLQAIRSHTHFNGSIVGNGFHQRADGIRGDPDKLFLIEFGQCHTRRKIGIVLFPPVFAFYWFLSGI